MANEIKATGMSGATLYAIVLSGTGQAYNGATFEAIQSADWSTYKVRMDQVAGTTLFLGTFPNVAAGTYTVIVYLQAGGSPAASDTFLGAGTMLWTGTAEQTPTTPLVVGTLPSPAPLGYGSAVIHFGTCQAGSTATTIKLDSGASSHDDIYQNELVYLNGGTGADQVQVISTYNGTTKVAVITASWAVTPDATTTFQILPMGAVIVGRQSQGSRTVDQDYLGNDSLRVLNQLTRAPIEGATVIFYVASQYQISGPSAPQVATTTTDANGDWSVTVFPGDYTATFTFANFLNSVQDLIVT